MKIKEYAEKAGKSKATVYNLINASRYNIRQITDRTGNITEQGKEILSEILMQRDQEPEEDAEQLRQELMEAEKSRDALREEVAGLRQRITEAAERADKWERLYIELQDRAAQERAENMQQLKAAQILLSQQQEINSRLLMNPIKRLFAGRKHKDGE